MKTMLWDLRWLLVCLIGAASAGSSTGWSQDAPVSPPPVAPAVALSDELRAVLEAPEFKQAHWGLLAVDLATGEVLYELNADKLFAPASTTKLYSVATALAELGEDYRFETPVVRRGELSADGELAGDLILVASGDFSLGGRTDAEGRIAFTDADHTYANSSQKTELTRPDPLAGLEELARQVASTGIKRVRGDVLIDARLFEPTQSTGSGPSRVTPIVVNDNVIDITVSPSTAGSPAYVEWRPVCAAIEVDAQVTTAPAGKPTEIRVTSAGPDKIVVRGRIAAGRDPLVRVHEVSDPESFARSLFIAALEQAGVRVDASRLSSNDASKLPTAAEVKELPQVALLTSPPFAESARLILKVSHNLHASMLPLLVATRHGQRTLADGLRRQHDFLAGAGVSVETISFGGGAGGSPADLTTPRATVELLRYMATRPDFESYERGLPVLGIDGTLASAVDDNSPARGKVQAKTGTYYWQNLMNGQYVLTSKALAGYLSAKSGRKLAFAAVVNGVHLKDTEERNRIGKVLGRICEILYEAQ
ncbi:MAG: D-alanyl-D-alanine carboxypeptidase/D-alanyl-D-alanine-endopeptidase [Planctomycetaceae bacterium]|nr:D-alanyl-D-alanine carboxypeptidase/D-alanyl-D-alanine-endopeptidase [Planctomycetaceae bacterium]